MALLPIHLYGDPVLRKKSEPIEAIDDALLAYAIDMLETMHESDGIGLAAVQVGRPIRMLVADVGDRAPAGAPKIFINPEILEAEGELVYDEGCLSIPGISAEITRPARIRVRFTDGRRKERDEWFDDLLARVLQHEIDHLDGKLFVDYLSPIRRALIMKKLQAIEKESKRLPAL